MRSKSAPTSTSSARLFALFPPFTPSQNLQPELKLESPEPESDRAVAGTPPLGPGGPFKCPQCGGAYPNQQQLEKHEILHSPSTQTCKQCGKSFANVYRLQRHMLSHNENAELRKFKCNDCDKAFKFKHHLKEHLRIHSGEKPFECGNCSKKFSHSGSYSSHMTSKKCLVMNLKMGRIKPNNPALNPNRSPSRKRHTAAMVASLNNNIANGNGFLPILPKYNEAAAAALFASMSPQEGGFPNPAMLPQNLHPFYIPHGMQMSPSTGITPYSFPTSINQILERIASTQFHHRKIEEEIIARGGNHSDHEDLNGEMREENERRSSVSSDRELVMDIEEDEDKHITLKEEHNENSIQDHCFLQNSFDRSAYSKNEENFKTMLQSVSTSVTKHFYQTSPTSAQTCPILEPSCFPRVEIKSDPDALTCGKCNATFNHKTELLQHEQVLCGTLFRKHEGLAAQVAETLALSRIEAEMRASVHSGVSASEDEECSRDSRERNDSTETEKKIRVRTPINEKQLEILKEHYAINSRPNREEFKRIAQQLNLENRVVQVWFQNNRARLRRILAVHSEEKSPCVTEQPLDLSTKKILSPHITIPSPSPPCSLTAQSDSGEEAMNLSQKSSRSTTPYKTPQSNYSHSNCSLSDFRHSPSPGESLNGFRTPHQRGQSFPVMPIEKLMQINHDIAACRSPLFNVHIPNEMRRYQGSPGFEKRAWSEESQQSGQEIDEQKLKTKSKECREMEGQFVCDQCDKTFVKQSSLARHKYEHSGQRPYKCIQCPKAFKHKHHLVEHKRLHTGEKPFQCSKCFKKFSHSGSYSQHMNHRYSYCKPYRE